MRVVAKATRSKLNFESTAKQNMRNPKVVNFKKNEFLHFLSFVQYDPWTPPIEMVAIHLILIEEVEMEIG
jgi:hypothetical protein